MDRGRSIEFNVHHARFPRAMHTGDRTNEAIREHPNNKFKLWVADHEELHRNVIYTPPFPYQIGQRVLRSLEIGIGTDDKIDAFVSAVEEALRHPRATRLDRQLGDLAISSLYAQAQFLVRGEYKPLRDAV